MTDKEYEKNRAYALAQLHRLKADADELLRRTNQAIDEIYKVENAEDLKAFQKRWDNFDEGFDVIEIFGD